jgi:hypothetical protein
MSREEKERERLPAKLEAQNRTGREEFRERAARLREETRGRIKGESADLIRKDRG